MLKHHRFKDIDDLYSSGRVSEARRLLMEMQAGYIAICDENAMLKMQVHELREIWSLTAPPTGLSPAG